MKNIRYFAAAFMCMSVCAEFGDVQQPATTEIAAPSPVADGAMPNVAGTTAVSPAPASTDIANPVAGNPVVMSAPAVQDVVQPPVQVQNWMPPMPHGVEFEGQQMTSADGEQDVEDGDEEPSDRDFRRMHVHGPGDMRDDQQVNQSDDYEAPRFWGGDRSDRGYGRDDDDRGPWSGEEDRGSWIRGGASWGGSWGYQDRADRRFYQDERGFGGRRDFRRGDVSVSVSVSRDSDQDSGGPRRPGWFGRGRGRKKMQDAGLDVQDAGGDDISATGPYRKKRRAGKGKNPDEVDASTQDGSTQSGSSDTLSSSTGKSSDGSATTSSASALNPSTTTPSNPVLTATVPTPIPAQ